MKTLLTTILVATLLLAAGNTKAQRVLTDTLKSIPNNAFQAGEELMYEAHYGFIKGGVAKLSIELVPHGYSFVYHATAVGETAGLASLYNVRDTYESYFSIINSLPVMAIEDIMEGNYRRYNELRFDHEKNEVLSLKSGVHSVPENILDILSVFYYARTYLFQHVGDNDVIQLNTFFEDELFPLKIYFKGYENVKTSFGRVRCMKFVPMVQAGGMVKNEDDVEIWLSADKNFVPIRIEIDLPGSNAKLTLAKVRELKYPLNIVEKERKKKDK